MIKRLEGDVDQLKESNVTLEKKLLGYTDAFEFAKQHYFTIKKIVKDYKKWTK